VVAISGLAVAAPMKDYQASVEKLRRDAEEAALIRDMATDETKRDMFDRLHQHFNRLADEVEQAMRTGQVVTGLKPKQCFR
jgi:Tfp pilus assembly protein PilE